MPPVRIGKCGSNKTAPPPRACREFIIVSIVVERKKEDRKKEKKERKSWKRRKGETTRPPPYRANSCLLPLCNEREGQWYSLCEAFLSSHMHAHCVGFKS